MAKLIKSICFFNTYQAWGGAEKWHNTVARWFRDRGHSVLAITNKNSVLRHRITQAAIPVHPIRISNLSFLNPVTVLSIKRVLLHHQIDTIILNLSSDAKVAGIAARLAGVQQVIYRRGTALPVRNTWLNRFVFKYLLTDVVANSQEIARTILQNNPDLIPKKRLRVIYNGLDLETYDRQKSQSCYQRREGEIVLGNAGRLIEQKGQRYLVELAKHLKTQDVPFTLLIAGTGALEKELRTYTKELGVEDEVHFIGFVEDIKGFMESLDIFLFPSLHEGLSNTLLEAMASSKPIVAFDVSSIPEIVISGETGLLAELGNIQALTGAVLSLMRDCSRREQFGKNGRKRLEQKFTLTRMLEEIACLVRSEQETT